jgi:hypothetical protein
MVSNPRRQQPETLMFVASTRLTKKEAPNQWDFHFYHINDDGWLAEGTKPQEV